MLTASELKEGFVLQRQDRVFRVTKVVHHAGSGQMVSFVALTLKDVRSGHMTEVRFKPTDRVETAELDKRALEFLYKDAETFHFMDPETFEQYDVPERTGVVALGKMHNRRPQPETLVVSVKGGV